MTHPGPTPGALPTTAATIDTGDGHPWHITLTWAVISGRPEPIAATLHRGAQPGTHGQIQPLGDGPAPITAQGWRAIPIAALTRAMRQTLELALTHHAETLTSHGADPTAATTTARRSRQGRPGTGRPRTITPEHLRRVAHLYDTAWQTGHDPTHAVARALRITRSAAAKQVAKARTAGMLPPSTRGRPQGNGVSGATSPVKRSKPAGCPPQPLPSPE